MIYNLANWISRIMAITPQITPAICITDASQNMVLYFVIFTALYHFRNHGQYTSTLLAIPISNGIAMRTKSIVQIKILPEIPILLLSIFVFLIPRNIPVKIRLHSIMIRNESKKLSMLICSPRSVIPASGSGLRCLLLLP